MIKKLVSLAVLLGIFSSGFQVTNAQDTKNCGDFANNAEVMDFWYNNGYSADNDPHGLDGDNDGLPCEVGQSEYDQYVANREAENQGDAGANDGQAQQGGQLPETATIDPFMMVTGAIIAAVGGLFFLRRKQAN